MAITTHDYFSSLVLHDHSIPLFESALAIGQDIKPDLDIAATLVEMDKIAQKLKRRLVEDAPHIQKLRTLNRFFFHELGFAGNINNYYDPDNSYLHRVLHTRRGIPISLAIVYMELAQQVGLNIMGISFPGHFLVKLSVPSGEIILDPLNGTSLSREELEERLEPYVDPEDFQHPLPLELYLRAAHPREILSRMLRNLKTVYTESRQWRRALDIQHRLVILLPDEINERRDRGITQQELRRAAEAIEDFEAYLRLRPNAPDSDDIRKRVERLRTSKRAT